MKLVEIELEGFRGYALASKVALDDLTVLAGRNDAGKSTVFEALQLFLGKTKPDLLDFSVDGANEIRITCTFSDLPPTLVIDETAPTTLAAEHLLDDQGHLRITKTWRGRAVAEVSAWAVHPSGDELPLLLSLKQAALQRIARDLKVEDSITDKRVNLQYRQAIWDKWIADGLARTELIQIPLNLEEGKQVAAALELKYPIFHLFQADRLGSESEDIAQDPAKLVVEAVLERHAERLQSLTTDVQEEVVAMLGDVIGRLNEIAPELASKLSPVGIRPAWQKAFSSLQFVDENMVPLAKRGSGTRRLVLLSFFRAEVERGYEEAEGWRRGIIIAIEEPETALHPDLQRETLSALMEVALMPNRQVFLTTHSPNLVRNIPIDAVRFVEEVAGKRTWISSSDSPEREILEHLSETMGIFSDHNVRCFLVVEGKNDIGGLLALGEGLQRLAPDKFPDLKALEREGKLCFIPIGGCGAAALWESRLSQFRRNEVHLLDSDRDSPDAPLKSGVADYVRRYEDSRNERAKVAVLERRELENYLTVESITSRYADEPDFADALLNLLGNANWDYVDVPALVAEALHSVRSESPWAELAPDRQGKKESDVKRRLVESFAHSSVAQAFIDECGDSSLASALSAVADSTTAM